MSSPLPSTQAAPLPDSEMQPAVPGFRVRAPVELSRSKPATASLPTEAT